MKKPEDSETEDFELLKADPLRLAILSILAANNQVEFSSLCETIGATDLSASRQLQCLQEHGFIKRFQESGKKQRCNYYQLTSSGKLRFLSYVRHLEQLLDE